MNEGQPLSVGAYETRWKIRRNERWFGHLSSDERKRAEEEIDRRESLSKLDFLRHVLADQIEVDHGLPTFAEAIAKWREKRIGEQNPLRVLVVTPPDEVGNMASTNKGIYPPLALWRIGSWVKAKGADVQILDGTVMTEAEIAQKIKDYRPDLIGLSVLSPTVVPAMRLSHVAKETGSIVVWGNDHASQNVIETMKGRGDVDVVIRGDGGDRWFGEMVEVLQDGKSMDLVPSASWRTDKGIRNNRYDTYDLDETIIPDPKLLSKEQFAVYTKNFQAKHRGRFGNVVTTVLDAMKGCAHGAARCVYCDIVDLRLQEMDPEHVAAEIEMVYQNYVEDGQRLLIYCVGDNLTSLALPYSEVFKEDFKIEGAADNIWLEELVEAMHRRGLQEKVDWFVYGRADDLVRPGVADLLEQLGTVAMNIGLDHFDDQMLGPQGLRKGNTYGGMTPSEINREAVRIIKEKKFALHASFVLGAPGETKRSLGNFVRGYRWMLDTLGKESIMNMEIGPLITWKGNEVYEKACRVSPEYAEKYKDADIADIEAMTRDAMKLFAPAVDFDRDIMPVVNWAKRESFRHGIVTGGPGLKE